MRFAHILSVAVLLTSVLTACITNPMTGRSQLTLVSENAAIARSISAYSQMVGELQRQGKLSTDAELIERINDITNRLISQAVLYRPETRTWAWSMQVIDDPKTLNAFCMAGGKMAVYTGLIDILKATDGELAQVIGHEIAHALAGHSAEKMSVAMAADLGIAVIAAAAGRNNNQRRGLYNVGALAAMAIVTLPNSREAETEADKLGIELAARAGYDPEAAVTLWKKMMDQSKDTSRADFFSTHPSAPNRIDALSELAKPMAEIYRSAAASRETKAYGWIGRSSNERLIGEVPPPGENGPALMFYSPEYDAFQKGKAVLTCTGQCNASYFMKQSGLKKEYDGKNWRALAVETVKSNFKLDLTYFYLAKAAKALGFPKAAEAYFEESRKLAESEDFACAKRTFFSCNGIDVRRQLEEESVASGTTPPN